MTDQMSLRTKRLNILQDIKNTKYALLPVTFLLQITSFFVENDKIDWLAINPTIK